ncbi:cupredoxin domain-containing protein [Thalassotalea sediminis]|uniref:cupredoxin domain-containing protein n=1 Tax=Thalassotalea sediminis TaxID=1759089 RepID=UPI0025724DD5|nr:cupredoxin domain-containing protein [Thalassotalea sediminis]
MKSLRWLIIAVSLSLFGFSDSIPEYHLVLKKHLFYPSEVKIPAGKKVKLVIDNQDQRPEEFDSFDLNREKVLFPGRKSVIYIGPLSPGSYEFFGEYNPNSAIGKVIVEGEN